MRRKGQNFLVKRILLYVFISSFLVALKLDFGKRKEIVKDKF